MNNTKKMTKKDYFNTLLTYDAVQSNPEMVAFIEHELELLSKKNSAERKPTAQQKENLAIQDAILDFMEDGVRYTITDIIKNCPECAELTNQRVSAIVRGMIGVSVERIADKRKAYFVKITT